MTDRNRPAQSQSSSRTRDEGRPASIDATQPWDYERHLEAEHNLLVDAEAGWPTAVKHFRLFRPMQGKTAEKTLVTFTGTGPAALAHFYRYIHPTARTNGGSSQQTWRR